MNSKQKEQYIAPALEVIKMETEGNVMSASANGSLPDVGNGGSGTRSSRTRSGYNAASSNDLEDMINDILTVDQ